MRDLFQSIRLFAVGFLKRIYFWFFALLIDPIDLYGKLKRTGWPEVPLSSELQYALTGAIVVVVIVAVFHEARMAAPPKPKPDAPLDDVLRFLTSRSKWLIERRDFSDKVRALTRDIRDALSIGGLSAFGRPTVGSHGVIPEDYDKPIEPLLKAIWKDHLIDVNGAISGQMSANTLYSIAEKKTAFYDIRLDWNEVKSRWRPIYLRRLFYRPLRLQKIDEIKIVSKEEYEKIQKRQKDFEVTISAEDRIRL